MLGRTQPTDPTSRRPRRAFQFRLSHGLVAVVVIALVCAALRTFGLNALVFPMLVALVVLASCLMALPFGLALMVLDWVGRWDPPWQRDDPADR